MTCFNPLSFAPPNWVLFTLGIKKKKIKKMKAWYVAIADRKKRLGDHVVFAILFIRPGERFPGPAPLGWLLLSQYISFPAPFRNGVSN